MKPYSYSVTAKTHTEVVLAICDHPVMVLSDNTTLSIGELERSLRWAADKQRALILQAFTALNRMETYQSATTRDLMLRSVERMLAAAGYLVAGMTPPQIKHLFKTMLDE